MGWSQGAARMMLRAATLQFQIDGGRCSVCDEPVLVGYGTTYFALVNFLKKGLRYVFWDSAYCKSVIERGLKKELRKQQENAKPIKRTTRKNRPTTRR